ncbi:hypothetical protein [Arcobacter porcinus]|uniref:Uncharacterized protein n=1 Tax=Arcobacter porcinus TaxID=1935204 RepID=A0A5C2HCD0_9BACT|nr:hypothetical protein [Arcobacter porcinus]OCL86641.1 hypothetical protein AAX30_01366 [Arcobacter porcinus]OCL96775.1 hypothetical protein AAX27_00407 [Aliarcobacter thereius]QEP40606.1 hypothetical protein APORC_1004 [Arcobacter porcinus]
MKRILLICLFSIFLNADTCKPKTYNSININDIDIAFDELLNYIQNNSDFNLIRKSCKKDIEVIHFCYKIKENRIFYYFDNKKSIISDHKKDFIKAILKKESNISHSFLKEIKIKNQSGNIGISCKGTSNGN